MADDDSAHTGSSHVAYCAVTVFLFCIVSFTFLFPCNRVIPLDRRTVAAVGAMGCYINSAFLFPSHRIDVLSAVDFDVLILLASIMLINHIVVHLKETKRLIAWFQVLVHRDPIKSFWLISFTAFMVSPFLTNDGVCLLLVEPILRAFDELSEATMQHEFPLTKADAVYFLLALACSTNIGSALTYTGNPQNMIVASAAIDVMPSYKFLVYMSLPALTAWLITTLWIEYCWLSARASMLSAPPTSLQDRELIGSSSRKLSMVLSPLACGQEDYASPRVLSPRRRRARTRERMVRRAVRIVASPLPYAVFVIFFAMIVMIFVDVMPISGLICVIAILMVLTVVLGNYWQNAVVWQEHEPLNTSHEVDAPAQPVLALPAAAAALGVAHGPGMGHHSRQSSLSDAIEDGLHGPQRAALGSDKSLHSRHSSRSIAIEDNGKDPQWRVGENGDCERDEWNGGGLAVLTHGGRGAAGEDLASAELPYTREDRVDNLNEFFDDLFRSVDYSLLLIFLGTFIVIESMASTGIPRQIWLGMVGKAPFRSVTSVVSISAFVLLASQLLGNVAVVQLAKPNVQDLDEADRRFAWSIIAFVATVGGNLTITGSAANIIVAEKANRLDASIALDFFKHYRVCCWVTLACCALSGGLLALIVLADNARGSPW